MRDPTARYVFSSFGTFASGTALSLTGGGSRCAKVGMVRKDGSTRNCASWWYSAQPVAASSVLTEEQPTRYRNPWCCAYCGDTAPQQRQHLAVAVLAIDAGPPQLQNLRPQMLVRSEVELLRAVVAQPANLRSCRPACGTCLQFALSPSAGPAGAHRSHRTHPGQHRSHKTLPGPRPVPG
jgi:hypothetical protein